MSARKSLGLIVIVAVACVCATSCWKHTYTVGAGAPEGQQVYKKWHHHFIFGLIGDKTVDVTTLCASGNATVKDQHSFVNQIIQALTLGIYGPTTVRVLCDDGKQTKLELTGEQVSEIVHDPRFLWVVNDYAPERLSDVQNALRNVEESPRVARIDP
jgi:hypothetical protein